MQMVADRVNNLMTGSRKKSPASEQKKTNVLSLYNIAGFKNNF